MSGSAGRSCSPTSRSGSVTAESRCTLAHSKIAGSPDATADRLREQLAVPQVGICLVNQLQPFLGLFVATVQVGVMALGELLVARLELACGGIRRQVQDGQHALGLAAPAGLPVPFGGAVRAVRAGAVDEQMERVLPAPAGAVPGDAVAERPGRPVPGDVLAQIGLDLALAHARKEIPGAVVVAHVIE